MAAFGNTPLAKAVAFTPIVAGYIYYSREYFEQSWGFQNAIWLYWSLLVLAIGQWIYAWRAPTPIKRFRDNEGQFVEQSLKTWSELQFEQKAIEYLRSGIPIHPNDNVKLVPENDRETELLLSKIHEIIPAQQSGDRNNAIRWLFTSIAKGSPVRPNVRTRRINPEHFCSVVAEVQDSPLSEGLAAQLRHIARFINQSEDSDDWKKEVLVYEFTKAQSSNPFWITVVSVLYFVGSLYFIWNTSKTILNIAKISIGPIASP